MATKGIAAHWLYKTTDAPMTESQVRAKAWVKNLLELQEDAANPLEFIENVKMDLFPMRFTSLPPEVKLWNCPLAQRR